MNWLFWKDYRENRLVVFKDGKISDIPFSTALGGEKKIDLSLLKLSAELSI